MASALAASVIKADDLPPALTTTAVPRILFDGCPLCAGHNTASVKLADCSHHPLFNPVVAPVMTWIQCQD
jgi:hypothetical protein